ncbi:MAG: sigma-54-dependent Fis family transcriptional regulator, partial [Clostridiales bacterium]
MRYQEKAWIDYVENGVKSEYTEKLYTPIFDSWERCKKRGQDINNSISKKVSSDELESRMAAHRKLIQVASPFLEELYIFVRGSEFMVSLLDEDACMLEVDGDADILNRFQQFRIGEIWDEETKGTNAMGIAKIERKPIQVFANEHYVKGNHMITCSAAPIFDENGEIIGILDITGHYKKAHMHTLGMVVAAVKAIENGLRLHSVYSKLIHSYNSVNTILNTISEGIISFDEKGNINNINQIALSILNTDEITCKGKKLKSYLKTNRLLSEILIYGRNIYDRELIIENDGKNSSLLLSGHPILDQNQEITGGVVILRESKNVNKLVAKVVGARARFTFDDIIGESSAIKQCRKVAKSVANSVSYVLLQGESGTGKEMFAQSIHNNSAYANGPFVAINCGAIPRDLIESELFGYMEGTFTGAQKGGQAGKFELANDGTIFLDEIGDMPLEIQVTLLRVLQEKQVVRIGGYSPIPINVRVISASKCNLWEEVNKGNFREDLYYRLNVIKINVPPLRERDGDVLFLAKHFVSRFSTLLHYEEANFDSDVALALQQYSWPGNVRELANAMERAVNLAKGSEIKMAHLP